MQRNNYKTKLALVAIGIVIIIMAWFKGCSNDEQKTVDVKVKETKGSFSPVKPEQKKIDHIVEVNKKVFGQNLSKKEIEFLQSEINRLLAENEQLENDFANANDSLMQVIYKQAISLKTFNHSFDNDTLTANVKGIVRGEIQNISLDYKIKSRTITIPNPKEVKFRLLAGIEVGNTKELNDFKTKATLGFQNSKGAIFSLGVDTEQRFYVGYTIPIFTIRR